MSAQGVKPDHWKSTLAGLGVTAGAALSDVAPTGHASIDLAQRVAWVLAVAAVGATAPPVLLVGLTAASGVMAIGNPTVGVPVLALAALVTVMSRDRAAPSWLRVAAAGAAAVGGYHLTSLGGFGRTAMIAGLIGVVLVGSGWRAQGDRARRLVGRLACVVAGAAGLCVVGAAITMLSARHHQRESRAALNDTMIAANSGELADAAASLDRAGQALESVGTALHRPWARLADLLPVVAQHRALAVELTNDALTTVASADSALDATNLERLKVENSRLDLDRVRAMAAPFGALAQAVDELRDEFDRQSDQWLIPPVRDSLSSTANELGRQSVRAGHVAAAARLAPDLLGGSRPRRMFVAFLTPSEARPLGGHLANFGELTITDGRIELTEFGRVDDLIARSIEPSTRQISGPDSYLARYGPFGAGGAGTPAGADWWLNVAISPDFPSVAQVISQLYSQSTGHTIDEVLAIDPHGLAALLDITGPVIVDGLPEPLSTGNVVELLTRTQYELFGKGELAEREEFLGEAGRATIGALLGRRRLDPVSLVKHLAEPAANGHVMLWSRDAPTQELFSAVGIDGAFALPEGVDALALHNLNAGANKTDAFLTRSIAYDAVVDTRTGELRGTIDVVLENRAPSEGLPFRVIGNLVDEPFGTNRMFVSLYTSNAIASMEMDGEPVDPAHGTELGWTYAERRLSLPSRGATRLRYEITGRVDPSIPYRLFVRSQPTVNPDTLRIQVHSTDGDVLVTYEGSVDGDVVLDARSVAHAPEQPADPSAGPPPPAGSEPVR